MPARLAGGAVIPHVQGAPRRLQAGVVAAMDQVVVVQQGVAGGNLHGHAAGHHRVGRRVVLRSAERRILIRRVRPLVAAGHHPQALLLVERQIDLHAVVRPVRRKQLVADLCLRNLDHVAVPAKAVGDPGVGREDRRVVDDRMRPEQFLHDLEHRGDVVGVEDRRRPGGAKHVDVVLLRAVAERLERVAKMLHRRACDLVRGVSLGRVKQFRHQPAEVLDLGVGEHPLEHESIAGELLLSGGHDEPPSGVWMGGTVIRRPVAADSRPASRTAITSSPSAKSGWTVPPVWMAVTKSATACTNVCS